METFWPTTLADVIAIITGLFVVVGGIIGLRRYYNGLRLQGADILLRVEEEFRQVIGTYNLIEDAKRYSAVVDPVLRKVLADEPLRETEFAVLKDIDRCIRFFYLCSVLNKDLAIDEEALARAYYHYTRGLLAERRPALRAYVDEYYPRLYQWIQDAS